MYYLRLIFIACLVAIVVIINSCTNTLVNEKVSKNESSLRLEQDVDYMTSLRLMQGHLLAAKELLDQGTPEQAEPHLGHPVNELYAAVEEQFNARNVKSFKENLTNLHEMSKYKPSAPEVSAEYAKSLTAIDNAIKTLPETKRQSPKFILQVIDKMLATANAEYEAGIANGRVVANIEYQDAYGFVAYAEKTYHSDQISSQVSQSNPPIHIEINKSFKELKKALGSVNPPEALGKTPEQLSELVTAIHKYGQQLS